MICIIWSDTFWAALGALATLVGAAGGIVALYFIYGQVKNTKEIAAYEFLRKEDDRFGREDMRRHRRDLARVLLLKPQEVRTIKDDAQCVLDYFEDLGLLRKKGLAPDYFLWTMNSYWILRYWEVLKHYVDVFRKERGDQTYYKEFESLYNRMLECEKGERQIGDVTFSSSELKDFLRGELDLLIRSFRLSDLDRILEIEATSFPNDAYPRSRFEHLYKNHPEGFVVADVLGEVVGYAIGYVSYGAGEIDSLAVDSCYRRLGIAQELLKRLTDHFREAGVETCSLEVRTTNKSAIKLYRKMGFEETETLKGYYADRTPALVMSAKISPHVISSPPD